MVFSPCNQVWCWRSIWSCLQLGLFSDCLPPMNSCTSVYPVPSEFSSATIKHKKKIDLTMNIIHVCIGLLMRKVLKKARIQVKSTLSYLSKRVVKLDHIDLFFLTQCPLWACYSQYWATMVPLNLGHHHSSINKNGIWKKK